jgi:DNA primase
LVTGSEDLSSGRGKSNVVRRMAPLVNEIADPVERQHYQQAIARLIHVDERTVVQQFSTAGRQRDRSAAALRTETQGSAQGAPAELTEQASEDVSLRFGQEEHILGYLLMRPGLLTRLDADMLEAKTSPLDKDDFRSAENRAILSAVQSATGSPDLLTADGTWAGLAEPLQSRCRAITKEILENPVLAEERVLKDLGDTLLRLRGQNLRQQMGQLQFLIQECAESGEREQLLQYASLIKSYAVQKRHIDRVLSQRSMAGLTLSGSRP